MRCVCPFPSDNNILPFLSRGIIEFYFGYIPFFWKKKYSLLNSINRRYSPQAQIKEFEVFKCIMKDYAPRGVKFHLLLNSPLYTSSQIDQILKTLKILVLMGLNSVILADIGLFTQIRKKYPHLDLQASCLTTCFNTETVAFYKKLGASRIILPRSLDLAEIRKLRQRHKDIKFEVLVFYEKDCINIDGFCTHQHSEVFTLPCREEKRFLRGGESIKPIFDSALRYFHLFQCGIEYMKIQGRGKTAAEILKQYEGPIKIIRSLSLLQPKSTGEWKNYLQKNLHLYEKSSINR